MFTDPIADFLTRVRNAYQKKQKGFSIKIMKILN